MGAKISQCDYLKWKYFCIAKEAMVKTERRLPEWADLYMPFIRQKAKSQDLRRAHRAHQWETIPWANGERI